MTPQPELSTHATGSDGARWVRYAWFAILIITGFRILTLALGKTELYLDEEQYWLWGQYPDFGYFSKPPLIGWLIGAVTTLAGSDSPFWVRMPAPLLQGATAAILAYWARSSLLAGRADAPATAFWIALAYLTLPIATVGSFVISTDTVMAPFLAGALLAYWRLLDAPSLSKAVLTGALIGIAMLAKYAGVYFYVFAAIAAVFQPTMRLAPGYVGVMLITTLIILAPNIYWNATHDFATLDHTAGNASWVGGNAIDFNALRFVEFLAGQAIVLGPIFLGVLLVSYARPWRAEKPALIAFSIPVFLVVGVQSFLADVNPNWTFSACLGASALSVIWLRRNGPHWVLICALILNGIAMIAIPLMTLAPERIVINDKPLLARYIGRSKMAAHMYSVAAEKNVNAILSADRSILADLFYYGQNAGDLPVYSVGYSDGNRNYYAQKFPLPDTVTGPVLYVSRNAPDVQCNAPLVTTFDPVGTYYQGRPAPKAFLLSTECLAEVTKDD